MKKVLTILTVLAMFLFLFTMQNVFAQEDPFEIGKKIAMTGNFDSTENEWFKEVGDFTVSYSTRKYTEVAFSEFPKSGTGTVVSWVKNISLNKYAKLTCVIKNWQSEEKVDFSFITKEEAEKEAWRILYYFR